MLLLPVHRYHSLVHVPILYSVGRIHTKAVSILDPTLIQHGQLVVSHVAEGLSHVHNHAAMEAVILLSLQVKHAILQHVQS